MVPGSAGNPRIIYRELDRGAICFVAVLLVNLERNPLRSPESSSERRAGHLTHLWSALVPARVADSGVPARVADAGIPARVADARVRARLAVPAGAAREARREAVDVETLRQGRQKRTSAQ